MRISDLHRRILAYKVPLDPDAQAYINAVEFADGQALEQGVKNAINSFVVGCKLDAIWNAIKASCILAGARTLNGALVPLKGTTPNNVDFVSGDYNRKTGLKGNGSSKYIDSNRNNNADPQNSHHLAVNLSENNGVSGLAEGLIGAGTTANGASQIGLSATSPQIFTRSRSNNAFFNLNGGDSVGLFGINRGNSSNYIFRLSGSNVTVTQSSQSPANSNNFIFARNNSVDGTSIPSIYSDVRITFYSIGESLNLALLDARVTTLINAYNSVI